MSNLFQNKFTNPKLGLIEQNALRLPKPRKHLFNLKTSREKKIKKNWKIKVSIITAIFSTLS